MRERRTLSDASSTFEFWNSAATSSGFKLLGLLVDYMQRLFGAAEAMASIYSSHRNSPLAQALPECQANFNLLGKPELDAPVPVMSVAYEGA